MSSAYARGSGERIAATRTKPLASRASRRNAAVPSFVNKYRPTVAIACPHEREFHRGSQSIIDSTFHLARTDVCEKGSDIRHTIEVLQKGALSLRDYPYKEQCEAPASPAQVAKATDFRVRGVKRIDISSVDNIKGQLAQSTPCCLRSPTPKASRSTAAAGFFPSRSRPA
jgi:hypothetical protein